MKDTEYIIIVPGQMENYIVIGDIILLSEEFVAKKGHRRKLTMEEDLVSVPDLPVAFVILDDIVLVNPELEKILIAEDSCWELGDTVSPTPKMG